MTSPDQPKILVVDDEEAILETMTFTFMDDYEVLTTTDAREGLTLLDEHAPVAVALTDQRMPNMTGVEFLTEVTARHPETVRIILTGFADMDAIIQAINDGQVYAYITKPWEPDQLKQVVKRAVDHHSLALENRQLLEELTRANRFLEAVMDRLDVGAIAIDAGGVVQAVNRPACALLHLEDDPTGRRIPNVLADKGLQEVEATVAQLAEERGGSFEDLELATNGSSQRLRISLQSLADPNGQHLGRVILFREVSHEPLQRRFHEIVTSVQDQDEGCRPRLEQAVGELAALSEEVRGSGVNSPGMVQLLERVGRTQTAVQSWLDVDDDLTREDYPDAQVLLDRMRVAARRWPDPDALPEPVRELSRRVEAYYESGENSKQRIL
ncbi:MAG: response regulator [Proteobacteria bacterium]|nr:response regulator [Pseudomonadota bacterium]